MKNNKTIGLMLFLFIVVFAVGCSQSAEYRVLTELPERESPLLQLWDDSEVKSGVSSDTLMI